jgi:putative transcriptional regulator
MSKTFRGIKAGLEDAIAHARGDANAATVHRPREIDVKAIRERTGLSQQGFCAAFGISLGTLRHWEQGLRAPRGPARTLLMVVDRDPVAIIRAIHESCHKGAGYHSR